MAARQHRQRDREVTGPATAIRRTALLSNAFRSLNNVIVVSHNGLIVDIACSSASTSW